MQTVIFTDLDGTLLDYKDYSFHNAEEALKLVKKKRVPLILCTSKTRAETGLYQKKLGINFPFIVENGAAIVIPEKKETIELGSKHHHIVEVLKNLKQRFKFSAQYEGDAQQLANETGLPLDEAKLAKKREYVEPIKIHDQDKDKLGEELKKHNLNTTQGGLYLHVMGGNDKGKAANIVKEMLKKKYGEIKTIGIGDAPNDFDMLDKVDKPYLVQRRDGSYASDKYLKAKGIGPIGWNDVIKKEIKDNP